MEVGLETETIHSLGRMILKEIGLEQNMLERAIQVGTILGEMI